jgi:hypothetical protein
MSTVLGEQHASGRMPLVFGDSLMGYLFGQQCSLFWGLSSATSALAYWAMNNAGAALPV